MLEADARSAGLRPGTRDTRTEAGLEPGPAADSAPRWLPRVAEDRLKGRLARAAEDRRAGRLPEARVRCPTPGPVPAGSFGFHGREEVRVTTGPAPHGADE